MDQDQETIAYLRSIFRSVDKDASGTLSKDEIATVMTQLRKGKRPPQDEIDKCFKDMDMDGNGNIDENEFIGTIIKWLSLSNSLRGEYFAHKYKTRYVYSFDPYVIDRQKTC
jgi:Ca2+-binding EF-hand superfamily protein